MGAELEARGEELFEREIGGAFVGDAGVVEERPGLAKVVVLLKQTISLYYHTGI